MGSALAYYFVFFRGVIATLAVEMVVLICVAIWQVRKERKQKQNKDK